MATQGRNGWVCLHRKSLDSMAFLSKKAEVWKVWSWCLMRARWQGGTLPIEYQSVKVLPGQFIYGRKEACEELLISERTFRTCITTLVAWGSITVKTTNKYSIATVVNWVTYQSRDGQNDQPTTNQRPTNDQPTTTINKENKVNKENKQQPSALPKAEARLSDPGKKAARTPKAKAPPDPRVKTFIDWFVVEFKQTLGRAYVVCGAKDGMLTRSLLRRLSVDGQDGLAALQAAARTMLADDWGQNKADLGLLSSQINKWAAPPASEQNRLKMAAMWDRIERAHNAKK